MRGLRRDAYVLFATRIVRMFAYGFLSVVLVLYLADVGLSDTVIGVLLSLTLLGDTVISLWVTTGADRIGRRRMLILGAVLMLFAGAIFAFANNILLLIIAAIIGVISPSGYEVGPFLAIEQAALTQTFPDERRTGIFAWYNLIGSFATALGALAGGALPHFLQRAGTSTLNSYRAVVLAYAAMGVVLKLSALFGLDAFAGGFVMQSIVAYWFHIRFGVETATLGGIFFGANLLAGVSALAAAWVARKIGLVNTMVFTHLPSNVLLILVPLMPNLPLPIAVFLLRFSISQMDVPTRQSYTMAVVAPDERSAAAGVTGIARTVGAALSPALAGVFISNPVLMSAPFLVAGGLKVLYDLLLFRIFRSLRTAT